MAKSNPTPEQIAEWKKEHGEVYVLSSVKGDVYLSKPTRPVLGLALSKAKTDILGASEVILSNCWLYGDDTLKNHDGFKMGVVNQLDAIIETVSVEVKKI